ncbi:nitrate transporter 1:2 [Perilla frutescens var. hirtella]|uniref:Nitrate transporter 1:2 n=1 Tax=Perilla frutescens var. hirtella TaxID=608512 RepID=A0AAD4IPH0_PERFH|nr:nitrate transporter 1:2 [Perilla frutescens var. hirtella]
MENQMSWRMEGYVDWRGKAAVTTKHGGMRAAVFVLVVEVLENLAYLANASNLVLYLTQYMHLTPSESANSVTNFMGTAFLLALLGGFLSDAFLTAYNIYLISAILEFLGLVILTMQAQSSSLQPPKCDPKREEIPCQQVNGAKAALLFSGLYLVALGVGGIKGSLPAHGAEQFDENTPRGRKERSTFFNYFVFSLAAGSLIAVTLVVWIEDNKGWQWGFGISTLTILLSIPMFLAGSTFYRNKIPLGSPLTTICKVLIASLLNYSSNAIASMATSPSCKGELGGVGSIKMDTNSPESPSQSLKFLNRAAANREGKLKCSVQQVEEVKIVMKVLPIFGCTIILNCCLAQLSTFSVQQAATMNTNLGSLKLPPASLPVFPVVFIMILAPLYDHVIIPLARKVTKSEMGISHLQRIGTGLILSIIAMAAAALVETKRRRVASDSQLLDSETTPLPITFLWIAFQYLLLGSADLFTLAGLLEFFFTEAPFSMRSLATSLSFASLAMGYYLSTLIVSLVNGVTGHEPWLSGTNLNHYQLHRFYWLMCALSGLNFLHYLFWATKYKYRSPHNTSA